MRWLGHSSPRREGMDGRHCVEEGSEERLFGWCLHVGGKKSQQGSKQPQDLKLKSCAGGRQTSSSGQDPTDRILRATAAEEGILSCSPVHLFPVSSSQRYLMHHWHPVNFPKTYQFKKKQTKKQNLSVQNLFAQKLLQLPVPTKSTVVCFRRLCSLAPALSLVSPHSCNVSRAVGLCMHLWDGVEATTRWWLF